MTGTTVGSIFTYFSNRYFAFGDSAAPLVRSGSKFVLMTIIINTVHGQVVVWLRDDFGFPYPLAKIIADLLVATIPQLIFMRFVVFPKDRAPGAAPRA
jgi:putative flippase GtrA